MKVLYHSQQLLMSSKYSDEKIEVSRHGYQRSHPRNLRLGRVEIQRPERLDSCKSHFQLHNEGRQMYILLPESGGKK